MKDYLTAEEHAELTTELTTLTALREKMTKALNGRLNEDQRKTS
jgi:hypothetical protein